ncbi:MAG: alpha-ketoacid dehydrogenase subunit beta [Dehalococcoidia bacterium]
MREITMREAYFEGMAEEMRHDPTVYVMSQSVTPHEDPYFPGFGRLLNEFGPARVRPVGIVERLMAGSAVGAALAGCRPIIDFGLSGFATLAYDEVFAKAGLWLYEHGSDGGLMKIPVVFCMVYSSYGTGGAEHFRSPLGHYMHGVGIKVVAPTSPYEAKGLIKSAIRDNNPVVFMMPIPLVSEKAEVPEEEYTIPMGQARVVREGSDCTIAAVGYQVKMALEAAEALQRDGINAEVIDLRSLIPLDIDTVLASVRKTGRLVEVDEDFERCGVGAEVGFLVQKLAFDSLKAPVERLANPNIPPPSSPVLNREIMPNPDKIADLVRNTIYYEAK